MCPDKENLNSRGEETGKHLIIYFLSECAFPHKFLRTQSRDFPEVLTGAQTKPVTHSDLTSRSPTSKDQISSLFSTFQTLIKPPMSPVATREESWLNMAHVTESLWPAETRGNKDYTCHLYPQTKLWCLFTHDTHLTLTCTLKQDFPIVHSPDISLVVLSSCHRHAVCCRIQTHTEHGA